MALILPYVSPRGFQFLAHFLYFLRKEAQVLFHSSPPACAGSVGERGGAVCAVSNGGHDNTVNTVIV